MTVACNTSSIAQHYRDSYIHVIKMPCAERKNGAPTRRSGKPRSEISIGVTLTALTHLDPPRFAGGRSRAASPSSFTRGVGPRHRLWVRDRPRSYEARRSTSEHAETTPERVRLRVRPVTPMLVPPCIRHGVDEGASSSPTDS